jgi:pimeloyl-ACP methyl ester carboxylesterase
MPFIDTREGRLFFSDHRTIDSPYLPLILVHGAGGSRLDWPKSLRRLPIANTIVLDLPGHGKSDGPGRQSVAAYANIVIAFMDALELSEAMFMGHSMGGAVVQQLALDYPDTVAGLILIGTGAKLRVHPLILDRILSDPEAVARLLAEWFWGPDVSADVRRMTLEANTAINPQVLYYDYAACDVFDIRSRLHEIHLPVLVISGDQDRMTPVKYGAYLRDHLSSAELVVIEGGGHMMALEQPELVTSAVQVWLEQQYMQRKGRN